ncbi:hypothetical protein FKM82_027856 [Ascaphus truei]
MCSVYSILYSIPVPLTSTEQSYPIILILKIRPQYYLHIPFFRLSIIYCNWINQMHEGYGYTLQYIGITSSQDQMQTQLFVYHHQQAKPPICGSPNQTMLRSQ